MKKIINILQLLIIFSSCSNLHCNWNKIEKHQLNSNEIDTFEFVKEECEEKGNDYKRDLEITDNCINNEYVQYNPVLKNECSKDSRLTVSFILNIDTIVNDTIRVKDVEIEWFRDSNKEFVEKTECVDYFMKQLREKVYLYKCNNVKRKRLKCVAFPPYVLNN